MTKYNTGNPVGSADPRDLYDNAQVFDEQVNNVSSSTVNDRFGRARVTLANQLGYNFKGDYSAGITLNNYNDYIRYDGEFYGPAASATLPYTTTAKLPDADSNLVGRGDAVLRQELSLNPADGLGAALVKGTTIYCGSVAEDLQDLAPADGQVYQVAGWHAGSKSGASVLVFDASVSKSEHGKLGWSPTVPSVSSQAGATLADKTSNYLAGTGETDPGGSGIFVIQSRHYNVYEYAQLPDGSNAVPVYEHIVGVVNEKGSTGSSGKEVTSAVVYYPNGVHDFTSGSSVSIDVDNTIIAGQSPDGTIIKVASNEVFKWGDGLSAGRAHGGGVYQLKFYSDLGAADNTNICVSLYKTAHMRFERIRLRDVGGFAKLGDASATDVTSSAHFSDIMGWVANVGKPTFDLQEGAGFRLCDSYIYTNIPAPGAGDTHTAVAGQEFIRGLGNWDTVNVTNVNCNRYRYSINCQPSSGNNCNNWFFTNFFGDYSALGMRWNSDGGNIRNHKYTNVWSFCTEGDSFALFGGATGLLENLDFTNCQAMLSGDDGWSIAKGKNITINQCTSQGQGRVSGTGYGVFIDGGDDVRVIGGEHGLDSSATTPFTAQADYGVRVTSNAKRYQLDGITADGSINGYLIDKSATQPGANRIRGNRKIDGSNANYVSAVNITLPSSGGTYTNDSPFEKEYTMHGGTVTNVQKNGVRISTDTNITFRLLPDETFTLTYSAAPVVTEIEVN